LLGDLKTKYREGARIHRYGKMLWARDSAIESWAIKIEKHLAETNCAFVFAGNHYEGFSALTAQRLAKELGGHISLPEIAERTARKTSDEAQLDLL